MAKRLFLASLTFEVVAAVLWVAGERIAATTILTPGFMLAAPAWLFIAGLLIHCIAGRWAKGLAEIAAWSAAAAVFTAMAVLLARVAVPFVQVADYPADAVWIGSLIALVFMLNYLGSSASLAIRRWRPGIEA
jgi:hypothetical protein